jgi:hypothetical protein
MYVLYETRVISVSMREFLPGISREICMFSESREKSVEKSGEGIIILLREIKPEAGAASGDARSPRLRSTLPGPRTRGRTREAVSLAWYCCHVISVCSIAFRY